MEPLMLGNILKSVGLRVILGTTEPLSIHGKLKMVKVIPTGGLRLQISNPEAICNKFVVKLGDVLFIKSANIMSFGTLSDPLIIPTEDDDEDEEEEEEEEEDEEEEESTETVESADETDRDDEIVADDLELPNN